MSHNTLQTIYLNDYEKPHYLIDKICLTFVLNDTATHVTNVMTIRRNEGVDAKTPLILDGEALKLEKVFLNGQELHETEYETDNHTLILHVLPQEFELEIHNTINPIENKALDGLYKSGGIFCTQNEPEGFRRITYYIDRPDVMALFQTKIIAKKDEMPVLLSNGNLIDSGDLDEGFHYAIWEDPFPKPSYLYALVAGDLGLVEDRHKTKSGRDVALKIYCDPGNEAKCLHAMNSLKASMTWDENRFDREYDLDIYMIVAVDSFNMGAMENKGLNIFNSHYVLADQQTATDSDFLGIESVIGHEYFHNWTGNRITCRDWFQLTLKEGLTVYRDQEFSADLNDRIVQRISDVGMLRMRQFVEDASPTSHPIKPKEYIQINNFYTATVYEKGAEVIRMLDTLLGKEGFKKGMDLYFGTFDGQAITTEDFLWSMSEANGVDLTQFSKWYDQSGTPTVEASFVYDEKNKRLSLTMTQSNSMNEPLLIPQRVALLDQDGNPFTLQLNDVNNQYLIEKGILLLTKMEEIFVFEGITHLPYLSLNRLFTAPIKLHLQQQAGSLAYLMAHDNDDFNRFEASQVFALEVLHDLLVQEKKGQDLEVPQSYIQAFKAVVTDEKLSNALKAKMLEIPGIEILMQEQEVIDIAALYKVRNFLQKSLALELEESLMQLHDGIVQTSYAIDAASMGERALKNKVLALLASLDKETIFETAYTRFKNASNMTDRFDMLKILSNVQSPLRDMAQRDFYQEFHQDTLVMNKYLAVIASSELPGTLQTVDALQNDPVYDNIVPNLVRALIGSFARNHLHFHALDGSGYRFIAEKVIAIDLFNPQIASGLAGAFKTYRKMLPQQQALMKESLSLIINVENISSNVYEVVSKILDA